MWANKNHFKLYLERFFVARLPEKKVPPASFGDAALEPMISDKSIAAAEIGGNRMTLSWQKATKNGEADATLTYQASPEV